MTTIIKAHYDGTAIIPDEPVDLPLNSPLLVRVVDAVVKPEDSITGEELARCGLFGIWKDRTDIGDSLEYGGGKLRKQGETRHHQIDDPA